MNISRFTKTILSLLGLYIVITEAVPSLISLSTIFIYEADTTKELVVYYVVRLAVAVLYCFGAYYFLYLKRDWLAERIVAPGVDRFEGDSIDKLRTAFRLVCVFAGILLLFWVVPGIVGTISTAFINRPGTDVVGGAIPTADRVISFEKIANWGILLAISVYMLNGAPHFVQWHVDKTLDMCKNKDQGQAEDQET